MVSKTDFHSWRHTPIHVRTDRKEIRIPFRKGLVVAAQPVSAEELHLQIRSQIPLNSGRPDVAGQFLCRQAERAHMPVLVVAQELIGCIGKAEANPRLWRERLDRLK